MQAYSSTFATLEAKYFILAPPHKTFELGRGGRQKIGTAMGTRTGPTYANLFMGYFGKIAFQVLAHKNTLYLITIGSHKSQISS